MDDKSFAGLAAARTRAYSEPVTDEEPWDAQLRSEWKPERVKLLMIAASAPADGGAVLGDRFFYAAGRLGPDNLFRSVVEAMYGTSKDELQRTGKRPWLERLRDDGFFLLDFSSHSVSGLGPAERQQVLHEAVLACVVRASALAPAGVVVVKENLYGRLGRPLRAAGLLLLHNRPIAFPLGNTRIDFLADFNRARLQLPT